MTEPNAATMPQVAEEPLQLKQFVPILAVQFIGTLGLSVAYPFLVFLITDLGGATWTYGLVGATYSACQLFGAPLLGRWSDRTGRKPVLLVSQAGTLMAWLLFLLALMLPHHSLGAFAGATLTVPLLLVFLARALDGATGGNVSVASAYVADMTRGRDQERKVAFGRMGMAASLGFVVGPALAGLLGRWGYTAPVGAAAALSFTATVLCFFLREPGGRCPEGPPDQPTVTRVLGQQQKRCDRREKKLDPRILSKPIVRALLAATFVMFLAFNFFYAAFPVFAEAALEWDPATMGSFFVVLSGMMIVAQGPLLKAATKRLSPPVLFGLGMAGLTASFLTFYLGQSWGMFVGAVLFAVGNGLAWPTFQARIADVAEDQQGAVQGQAASAGAAASILGLILGGLCYPWLGASLFLAGAILFASVALGTRLWFKSEPPARPTGAIEAAPND